MSSYKSSLTGIVLAGALFSGAAHAGTVTPSLSGGVVISDGLTSNIWTFSDTASANPDGTFTYEGYNSLTSPLWYFGWDITVNPDPFINSTLTVVNNTSVTKHFNIVFTLPVAGFSPSYNSGSMGIVFTDFNGNSTSPDGYVSLANVDWNGTIDGSGVMSLASFDASCGSLTPPGSPGCSVDLGTVSDGPLFHHAGVASSIGIQLAFDLTAHDKAVFTNFFEVVPVPLPAAVWLFGAGLGMLSVFARKKK